jgi:transcriptional regulator with XRE-family HTH domain
MVSALDKYKRFLKQPNKSVEYWRETAVLDFTEELAKAMNDVGMTRTDLAERVGASKSYVTKVFSGESNFTIETMAKFAIAVDHAVRIHIAPLGSHTVWMDRHLNHNVVTYDAPAMIVNLQKTPVDDFRWEVTTTNG